MFYFMANKSKDHPLDPLLAERLFNKKNKHCNQILVSQKIAR